METKKNLNIDVAGAITQLHSYLKSFQVRNKRYKIFFRGKSFEFDGFRTYSAEDDMSSIDWKASRRADKLLVRQYKEEEDKKIFFLIDVSEQMISGTNKLKCEFASELALALAYIMTISGNRVGMILFSDKIKGVFIPKRGMKNFYFLANMLADPATYGKSSNLNFALDFVVKNFDTSVSTLIIVSDLLNINKETKHYLELVNSRIETFALMIRDPIDKTLPSVNGEFVIEDPNTGEQLLIDPKLARKTYEKYVKQKDKLIEEVLKDSGTDFAEFLTTQGSFAPKLSTFLNNRLRKPLNI